MPGYRAAGESGRSVPTVMWLLLVLAAVARVAQAAPGIVYDQRQTSTSENGGFNVHVQLEDILLVYVPSGGLPNPTSILPYFSFHLKRPHETSESMTHHSYTLPPEFEGQENNTNSPAVQEAIAASIPEIPEAETNKPSSTSERLQSTTEPVKPLSSERPATTSVKPNQQYSNETLKSSIDLEFKHDSQNSRLSAMAPIAKAPQQLTNQEQAKPVTIAIIEKPSEQQKQEPIAMALVSRPHAQDVESEGQLSKTEIPNPGSEMRFLTPVSQAIALYNLKREPSSPASS